MKGGLLDQHAVYQYFPLTDQLARLGTGQIGAIAKKFVEPHAKTSESIMIGGDIISVRPDNTSTKRQGLKMAPDAMMRQ
ncbi:hypothetical protein KAM344_36910 [Aeromonas caviae]|nr:hypothetical protein KAM344_36910 [Aeromonas caviae]